MFQESILFLLLLLSCGAESSCQQLLPTVDLSSSEASSQLLDAAQNFGFFYVINHGIDGELIDAVFGQAKEFFARPTDEKMQFQSNSTHYGYDGKGSETLDRPNQSRGDTKEGMHVGPNRPNAYRQTIWPNYSDSESILRYFLAVETLGKRLAQVTAGALGVRHDFFDDRVNKPLSLLRMVRYSSEASDLENGVIGCGGHTDYGMYTILAVEDNEPGLQIMYPDGTWRDVPRMEGGFVVNAGDMLQQWTNDRFKSTLHRVVIPQNRSRVRFSMPFFFGPNPDALIEVIPREGDLPKYAPVVYREHFEARMKDGYGGDYQPTRKQ
jgi:isopenicillin N synthase-like dioxygenase